MGDKTKDVIEGFNAYVDGLLEEDQVHYRFSLTLFDTEVTHACVAIPLKDVKKLDSKSYRPGGNTALNDAIGLCVRKVESENHEVDKVITVIMTDGEENSSREWGQQAIRSLIEQKEKEGNWTFVFLGAGLDAWTQGKNYGISSSNVRRYSKEHYLASFAAMADGTKVTSRSAAKQSKNIFSELSEELLKKLGLEKADDNDNK
jgi:uncharacterized protein YegL